LIYSFNGMCINKNPGDFLRDDMLRDKMLIYKLINL